MLFTSLQKKPNGHGIMDQIYMNKNRRIPCILSTVDVQAKAFSVDVKTSKIKVNETTKERRIKITNKGKEKRRKKKKT